MVIGEVVAAYPSVDVSSVDMPKAAKSTPAFLESPKQRRGQNWTRGRKQRSKKHTRATNFKHLMKYTALLLFVLFVALAHAAGRGGPDLYTKGKTSIIQLTKKDFASKVFGSEHIWMIEFYAPVCIITIFCCQLIADVFSSDK